MSVATGIDPLRLAEIDEADGSLLGALIDATAERWTHNDELLAQTVELLQAVVRNQFAQVGAEPPPFVPVRRPGQPEPEPERPLSPSEFFRTMKRG